MVIISFTSGLGNQLFQYFFGESLKIKHQNIEIKYLNSLLPPDQIKLWDIFDINLEMIPRGDVDGVNIFFKFNKFIFVNLIKVLIKLKINKYFNVVADVDFIRDNKLFLNNKSNYIFYGYWQNTRYFNNNFFKIKSTLNFKKKLNLRTLHSCLKTPQTIVGVHIRGGDYLKNKNKNIFYNVNKEYYVKNILSMNKKLNNPIFIFFTDDLNYLNKLIPKLNINHLYIQDLCDDRNDDFQYLTLCDHFIIPNSTFSLWAAYFSNNKNKKIIVPTNWFNKDYSNDFETHKYFERNLL